MELSSIDEMLILSKAAFRNAKVRFFDPRQLRRRSIAQKDINAKETFATNGNCLINKCLVRQLTIVLLRTRNVIVI